MSTKDARKISRISFTSPFQQTTRSYQMNSMPTIRPAEPESPEIPDTQPQQPQITPPETLPSITWQELQAQQHEKKRKLTIRDIRIEMLGPFFEHIIGEIDWDLEGVTRCRVKGAPCYGRDYLMMTGLKRHLSSGLHKVFICQSPVMKVF